ncbi:MAG: ATP-binding cassette domain-containing protein [Clostridium sp.]|nr:ATP-binding cassette domain-containing protein [Clostridium sp.]
MIEFKDVSFSYDSKQVLKNFNLTIHNGDRICLWGDSGIGKTTILRLILGLEKITSGSLIRDDAKISVVFQEDRLIPFKTAEENIRMFADSDKTDLIISSLGISEFKNKYPSQLSGGMKRRTAIARALAVEADIYIFDEAFTGLDKENIFSATKLINEITENKTVILVTHNTHSPDLLNCRMVYVD